MATHIPSGSRGTRIRHRLIAKRPFRTASSLSLQQSTQVRLFIVWGMLMVGILGLVVNLVRLQIVQAPELRQQSLQQHRTVVNAALPRRSIVDRLGNVLAVDQRVYTLYAHPRLFKQPQPEIAVELAPILEQSSEALIEQFNQSETGVKVADGLSEQVASQILALRQDGLELNPYYQRVYPQQDLFANVVGYLDLDRQGQAGLEYSQKDRLERSDQAKQLIQAEKRGSQFPDQLSSDLMVMDDAKLQLTLDSRLQRSVQSALSQQVAKYNANQGAVLVMDVSNGALLALVTEPTYDPNRYYEYDVDIFRNWALTDLNEPGSTFKPLNVAIALEAGVIQPSDTFYDKGRIQIGKWPIENHDYSFIGGRGELTIDEILKHSSNVGMVFMMERLSPEAYYNWLEKIGLESTVGLDLPFEVPPQIKSREQFTGARIEPATTAFGQGFSLTPIHLIQLHGALANGGKLVTPHVVKGLFDSNHQAQWQPTFSQPKQIFSPKTTRTVLDMMEKIVEDGTGKPARISGYRIAGKTGTAQKASPNGGYYENAKVTSFVGIFPAEAPRYVVLAIIDEPQGNEAYGSTVAAPVVKSTIEALITLEGIPPSRIKADQANKAQPAVN
ncbi:MAG: penicillin-binding protein 2 [Cyanothece sp. SIO1E1]|nr:penicillin-binding protein 2 [Cyanothece sp. SIO1E1]